MFSVGSGATYAYGIMDSGYKLVIITIYVNILILNIFILSNIF